MLRILQLPDCAETMYQILDFQRSVLEFARDHKKFDHSEMVAFFGNQKTQWLEERDFITNPLFSAENFMRMEQTKKDELYNAFLHDIEFQNHINDNDFEFLLPGGNYPGIKSFGKSFYDIFKSGGFPSFITGGEEFHSGHWWTSIERKNSIQTCPVCDQQMATTRSIDHYLPQDSYPALSIHPMNLFPCCKICNNEIKKSKDPLIITSMNKVIHPYIHSLDKFCRICFTFHSNEIHIEIIPTTSNEAVTFGFLFKLPELWEKNCVAHILDTGFSQIQTAFFALKTLDKEITLSNLSMMSEKISSCHWGKKNLEYLANYWVKDYLEQCNTKDLESLKIEILSMISIKIDL
jgi:hypothetical protein